MTTIFSSYAVNCWRLKHDQPRQTNCTELQWSSLTIGFELSSYTQFNSTGASLWSLFNYKWWFNLTKLWFHFSNDLAMIYSSFRRKGLCVKYNKMLGRLINFQLYYLNKVEDWNWKWSYIMIISSDLLIFTSHISIYITRLFIHYIYWLSFPSSVSSNPSRS